MDWIDCFNFFVLGALASQLLFTHFVNSATERADRYRTWWLEAEAKAAKLRSEV